MVEHGKSLVPAALLPADDLEAVLEGLGPAGDGRSRLHAVIALLTGDRAARHLPGGAFAEAASVTVPFTTGLHNCLRGASVNDAQHEAIKIRLGKQC